MKSATRTRGRRVLTSPSERVHRQLSDVPRPLHGGHGENTTAAPGDSENREDLRARAAPMMEAITPDEDGRASPVEQGLSALASRSSPGAAAAKPVTNWRQWITPRLPPECGLHHLSESVVDLASPRWAAQAIGASARTATTRRARQPRGVKKPSKVNSVPEGDVVVQVTMSPPFGMPGLLKTILPDCVS